MDPLSAESSSQSLGKLPKNNAGRGAGRKLPLALFGGFTEIGCPESDDLGLPGVYLALLVKLPAA